LDKVGVLLSAVDWNVSMKSADDPHGYGVLIAERIADRNDGFSPQQIIASTDMDDGKIAPHVDLDHRKIGFRIVVDQFGDRRRPVS